MKANLAIVLTGLWLAYRAIFSIPAAEMGQLEMTVAGLAVIALAAWARSTDLMSWPSDTNIALGVIIFVLAAAEHAIGVDPLVAFWIVLLAGITAAIVALWSILYRRPGTALIPDRAGAPADMVHAERGKHPDSGFTSLGKPVSDAKAHG